MALTSVTFAVRAVDGDRGFVVVMLLACLSVLVLGLLNPSRERG